jgi:pilus assembly protein CpaF
MNVQLVVQSDGGQERTELFQPTGPITVGRHPNCVLRLDSDLVSRQHAVLNVGPASIRVEDVSTNGTLAGDQLLRREAAEVPFGTPIVVGNFTIYMFPADGSQQAQPLQQQPAHQSGGGYPAQATGRAQPHHVDTARHARPPMGQPMPMPMPPQQMPPQMHGQMPMPQPMHPPPPQQQQQPPQHARQQHAQPQGDMVQRSGARDAEKKARERDVALRRKIHKILLEHLDLATIDPAKLDDPSMRPKVLNALRRIVTQQLVAEIPAEMDHDRLIGELADEALGLGPLERFLGDPSITEIMVVDPENIYIEQGGKLTLSEARFTDDDRCRAVIERIVTPLGRRIDESSPLVDARLKDGSRVNAIIRPLALRGSCITIRKFSRTPLTLEKLVSFGSITERMTRFLVRSVIAKKNIVISGGTGSGKTTLLNCLSGAIPSHERIVTIEDAAELQLPQPHVVQLETRPANLEGKGEYTIRDLVKNALRMRPDRIVVGECRGGEALDMLQAMNTGHDGSLTTTHANSPPEAISRLETLVLMSGLELPVRAIRDQISSSVHVIVQQSRLSDGSRRVTDISEVTGIDEATGEIELRPIFNFVRTGTGKGGKVIGEYRATGYLPSYLNDFIVMGLVKKGEPFL